MKLIFNKQVLGFATLFSVLALTASENTMAQVRRCPCPPGYACRPVSDRPGPGYGCVKVKTNRPGVGIVQDEETDALPASEDDLLMNLEDEQAL